MPAQGLSGLGNRFRPRLSCAQVPTVGVAATFANDGNGKITIAGLPAHGLTFNPAAGVMPNYFVTFSGSTGESGGTLNGNIFRLLAIPSTTSLVIYGTLTAATVTTIHVIPVFFMPFAAMLGNYMGQVGPVDSAGVVWPPAAQTGDTALLQLGANCEWQVNPDNTATILDPVTTPASGTPSTAPAWVTQVPASSNDLVYGGVQECLWASGSAGTSYAMVYE